MSSLFGQVWFWSLLAFLVGALMTSLLLVRPLSKRVKELEAEQQSHEPRLLVDDAEWEKADAEIQSWSASEQDTTTIDKPVADYHDDPDWLESDSLDADRKTTESTDSPEDPDEFFRRDDQTASTQEELQGDFTAEDFASPSDADADTDADAKADSESGSGSGSGAAAAAGAAGIGAAAAAGAAASKSSDHDEDDKPSDEQDEQDAKNTKDAGDEETDEHPRSASVDAATEINPAAGELPQRRKRGAGKILGGFGTPKPIKPSLRKTKRRDTADADTADGAALFEAKDEQQDNGHVADGVDQHLAEQDHEPAAEAGGERDAATESHETVPAGPFGAGSAMPLPGGEAPDPAFKVKGSVTALRYCTKDSSQFDRMVAEVWFASVDDAERVGFRAL